jgi:hypothetical protein
MNISIAFRAEKEKKELAKASADIQRQMLKFTVDFLTVAINKTYNIVGLSETRNAYGIVTFLSFYGGVWPDD